MRKPSIIVVLGALAGCASLHDPGWQGRDAQPFDAAHAQCEAEAAASAAGEARTAAFEACMAAKGWTRSPARP